MESELDFGCITASSQLITRRHPLINKGSAPGVFQVQYSGDPAIKLSPCNGVIAAGATLWLRVELRTDKPRLINEKALVKLQHHFTEVLSIKAEVVDQHLEVSDLQGNPVSCLSFGPVYFGTSRVESIVLRNAAPQACDWVCLLQSAAAGTEVGTDLQKCTNTTRLDGVRRGSSANHHEPSHILVCVPKEGRLGPYEKTTVAVRFSPISRGPCEWPKRGRSTSRQDYSLFLLFESVRSRHGFTRPDGNSSVELAVTGSGLPVSLLVSPERLDFPKCALGQRVDLLCQLHNASPQLPINFRFRKLAHFTTEPSSGTIEAGQRQDILLSFIARQQGRFQMCQKLHLLGYVACHRDGAAPQESTQLRLCGFHTVSLRLTAVCCIDTSHAGPKINTGITPAVTNPIGAQPLVKSSDLPLCRRIVHVAVLCTDKTRYHMHQQAKGRVVKGDEFLAFPNDRACSIRPASMHARYSFRTIFTGVSRYTYLDTDYAFTEQELEQRQRNRKVYADFVEKLRQTRLQRIKKRKPERGEDAVDIGIVPAQGLLPPKLRVGDLDSPAKTCLKYSKMVTEPSFRQISSRTPDVMHTVPSSSQEVADCDRTLTPQELYQVVVGPLLVDFGEVCVQSVCVQTLELVNQLPLFVWVQLEVDCVELRGSSPLSHVLLPKSRHTVPLTFQSNNLGHFYRPVSYTVNRRHPGQVLVQAQVVPIALEMSTSHLVLRPDSALLAASGYRASLTLRNRRNYAAEFTWVPLVTDNGILFSVRPATGTVEPYMELDCEVVWHASFSSPPEGDFDLCVVNGNTQRLHCSAKVGSTTVQLADARVTFGSVPLNMPSVRTAILHNTGPHHAYFQVLQVCPLAGMVVSPCEGVVPSGGQASLRISFSPETLVKFDTRVEIALRNMKSIELRVGGTVVLPNVEISTSNFHFNQVHMGSQKAIPFSVSNRSSAAARFTIDLSENPDFSLQHPPPSDEKKPGVSTVEIQGGQTADCSLVFSPTQLATYDFDLQLRVNGVSWPVAAPSSPPPPLPASATSSSGNIKHTVKTVAPPPTADTQQTPRVQGIVLCAPLEMSPSSLRFLVESLEKQDPHTQTVELRAVGLESVWWRGVGMETLYWWFERGDNTGDGQEAELCNLSPSSGRLGPGETVCVNVSIRPEAIPPGGVSRLSLPLYVGKEEGKKRAGQQPYRELRLTLHLQLPRLRVSPLQLLLTAVPLESKTMATLSLLASGYPSGTTISAEVDEVQLKDGTKVQPVSISFPEGNSIPALEQNQSKAGETFLICTVSFSSAVSLSMSTTITFTDQLGNRFKVKLWANADKCLLTVWPFLALHHSEQRVVLKTGVTTIEANLQRYHTPSPAPCLTSSSSSFCKNSSSTNKNSNFSDLFPDSESRSSPSTREDGVSPQRSATSHLGVPEFQASGSLEGLYYQSVLLAVERWFSLFGWPNQTHPIAVPHTLRRVTSKINKEMVNGRTYRVSQSKDSRSVMEMIHHLTGTQIPNVSRCQTFSSEVEQRTTQLLEQHRAMLDFLSVQGACLSHIQPEYLLDVQEFNHWCSLQKGESRLDYSRVDYESLSKRSWTDVLLQIYKVSVLCRVSRSNPTAAALSREDVGVILNAGSQPLASNIYSAQELQVLAWLNLNYHNMRGSVWSAGGAPSARWIVNFDLDLTDGLVLAALLAAYCPYLICSHLRRMYTRTSCLEQILHNNIILVQALNTLSLNIDMQPTDLSDPNPVQMLMLCVHLYERLPEYLPRHTITLSGGLHSTLSKQVRLRSPSLEHVRYKAFLLGEDAHLFSLPAGSTITIPPKASKELTVQYRCSFLQPMEAVLLLISSSTSGLRGTTLAFSLKTSVSHITPTKTIKCRSPCYTLRLINVPITNPFSTDATFSVVLVESTFNPLEPEKRKESLVQQASSKANMKKITLETSGREEMEGNQLDPNGDASEFLSAVKSVHLKAGQTDTLNIHYLPFCPGGKFCSVLLVCPKVGDMVYMVKATAELPPPSPLTARPSSTIFPILNQSGSGGCVSVLRLRCRVGEACGELLRLPLINMAWERALALWGQRGMSGEEQRRRALTHTLTSSTVRSSAAAAKLRKQLQLAKGLEVEYSVEASQPQYFTLPKTVRIPLRVDADLPWENPADCGCVDVPLRFQADSVGQFTCQMVLRSWYDTRVYLLEALVTSQEGSVHLDFNTPAHHSVTQDIPLLNETKQDWRMKAVVLGSGFFGPEVLTVPAGTKTCYPLTFHPSTQCVVMGKLSLHNDCNGIEHLFTLRGLGEHPLPAGRLLLHCPVGKTTHTQLDVPNYSQRRLHLQVVTDLSVVSGNSSLEIKAGRSAPYTLAVSPWKRGQQSGHLEFLETDGEPDVDEQTGDTFGPYEVYYTVEIVCEPAAPLRVIEVQCTVKSSVAIEIPVSNPGAELLMLAVSLEGDSGLSGASWVSVPPEGALLYKATFSPGKVGKSAGSVVFQSEAVGEFWYQLDLYSLPSPVATLPPVCCQLGKLIKQTIPVVNPTAEPMKLEISNSNPRNFPLELESGNNLIVEPHSSAQLGVCFTPSSIGAGNHTAKITFTCPQLQEWSVLLSGRGLTPEREDPVSILSAVGSSASVTIPFTNPSEGPAALSLTLSDTYPAVANRCHPAGTNKEVFSLPLHLTEGVQMEGGASLDVPVVFAPQSMDPQQAWLCIAMKPLGGSGKSSKGSVRAEEEPSTICWIFPLCGIPMEAAPVQESPLCTVQCEAGCQLERKVDVQLAGCMPAPKGQRGPEVSRVTAEDFVCEMRSGSRAKDGLTAAIDSGRRNPKTGILTLTINLTYAPLRPCRRMAVLVVRCKSGQFWEFPIVMVATDPQVDDVIITDATDFGQTSCVGFRLTSTTRRAEPFAAAFLPGSSGEFSVVPASGMLPPVDSRGALISVSFTPDANVKRHRARLSIQAADMQWSYDVRGITPQENLCSQKSSSVGSSTKQRQQNLKGY